jgi:hypothetical protein
VVDRRAAANRDLMVVMMRWLPKRVSMQAPSLLSGPSIRSACTHNVGLTLGVYVKQGKPQRLLEDRLTSGV